MESRFSVAILGGGPAGASMALTLARAGISVVLLESSNYQAGRVGELLSPEGVGHLQELLGSECEPYLLNSIGVVSAWESRSLIRQPAQGTWRAIDRTGIDLKLALDSQKEGAQLLTKCKVKDFELKEEGLWEIAVDTDQGSLSLQAELLVDATGRGSRVAKHFKSFRRKADTQTAIVAFLDLPPGREVPQDMLLETSVDGWWYAAPLTAKTAVAVFVTDLGMVKGEPGEAWRGALQRTVFTKERFGDCEFTEQPRRVACENSIMFPSCGKAWVAIGDAACCHDPFSSKGIGRVLGDSRAFAQLIIESFTQGIPFSPLLAAEARGRNYYETLSQLKASFRQVRRFPESEFWARRLKVRVVDGEDRETQAAKGREPQLSFASKQNFECSQCGKCCKSEWAPEVDQSQIQAIKKSYESLKLNPDQRPIELADDGSLRMCKDETGACVFLDANDRCSIYSEQGGARPLSCDLFPFTLRETPDGVQVGVSYLCSSVQKNEGRPLREYEPFLRAALARSRPAVIIPKVVPVSYGRVFDWQGYLQLERVLLTEDNPEVGLLRRLRHARWLVCRWAGNMHIAKPQSWDSFSDRPSQDCEHLDCIVAINLIVQFAREHETGVEQLETLQKLLEETALYLVSPRDPEEQELNPWVDGEIERYLFALVERKFLLIRLPVLHNLCLLCVIAVLLRLWTYHFAQRRGSKVLDRADFNVALSLVELRLVTYKAGTKFAHQVAELFLSHLSRDEGQGILQVPHDS